VPASAPVFDSQAEDAALHQFDTAVDDDDDDDDDFGGSSSASASDASTLT
jgi:hypothetical protein